MTRDDPQMKLRLPAELKARVEESANAAGRSLNAEIVYRLEASLSAEPRPPGSVTEELVAAVEAISARLDHMLGKAKSKKASEPPTVASKPPTRRPRRDT
jgi:hypothetical protein